MNRDYSDIINTEWPRPTLRPRMLLKDRAKIFLPFAALKGHTEALEETRIETESSINASETGTIFDDYLEYLSQADSLMP